MGSIVVLVVLVGVFVMVCELVLSTFHPAFKQVECVDQYGNGLPGKRVPEDRKDEQAGWLIGMVLVGLVLLGPFAGPAADWLFGDPPPPRDDCTLAYPGPAGDC